MGKKDGMFMYYDWVRPLKKVPAKDFKDLVLAMIEYHRDGTKPKEFDGAAGIAADFIFSQIKRSKSYADIGSKGGQSTQRNGVTLEPTVEPTVEASSDLTLEPTVEALNININKNINKNTNTDTNTNTGAGASTRVCVGECKDRFNELRAVYPRSGAGKEAFEAFEALSPDSELFEYMLKAIPILLSSEKWTKEGGRYIPGLTKYITERTWESVADQIQAKRTEEDLLERSRREALRLMGGNENEGV